jgi:hypothetical protein
VDVSRRRTDNTIAKEKKERQYNSQREEGQTIQWPKRRRTDNTIAKEKKDRQYNSQREEGQTIQ